MPVGRPLANADLRDESRLQPAAEFHCFRRQRHSPASVHLFGKIVEGALRSTQPLEPRKYPLFGAALFESIANLAGEDESIVFVIAHQERIEMSFRRGKIA